MANANYKQPAGKVERAKGSKVDNSTPMKPAFTNPTMPGKTQGKDRCAGFPCATVSPKSIGLS